MSGVPLFRSRTAYLIFRFADWLERKFGGGSGAYPKPVFRKRAPKIINEGE